MRPKQLLTFLVCNPACLQFAEQHLTAEHTAGRRVLEVGARDVNGSARTIVEQFGPAEYVGVDIEQGPGVDAICDIVRLVERFGTERFELVICTEVLEHVRDWRTGLINLKHVLTPGGTLLVTTRSIGFHYHGYPHDFWRFEPEDVEILTADMTLDVLQRDPVAPGVFFIAIKPDHFRETSLESHALHSIIAGRRCRDIDERQLRWFHLVKRPVTRFFKRIGRSIGKRLLGADAPRRRP